jgi:two-component system, response regulator PdtaR
MEFKHVEPWNRTPQCVLPSVPFMPRQAASILIVEDEALVRLLGVGMFADAGFRPIEAVNGDEALELLEANSQVQLLFTDVEMPGAVDGLALARQVRDRWPHIGIIVVSAQSMPQHGELPADCRFYRKPYDEVAVVRHACEMTAG